MKFQALAGVGVVAAILAAPANAHHSFAMFDHSVTSSLTGTVKEFEWINPHAWIHVLVMNADGQATTWSFEAGSTGQLTQAGWKRDDIRVGDTNKIGFHPLKDGSFGGQVLTVVTPDGKELCQGNGCQVRNGG